MSAKYGDMVTGRLLGHRTGFSIFKGLEGCNPHLRLLAITAHPSIPLKKYFLVAETKDANSRFVKLFGRPRNDALTLVFGATVIATGPVVAYCCIHV